MHFLPERYRAKIREHAPDALTAEELLAVYEILERHYHCDRRERILATLVAGLSVGRCDSLESWNSLDVVDVMKRALTVARFIESALDRREAA
jgi:hypothetical protein